jgi:hypothetical protein
MARSLAARSRASERINDSTLSRSLLTFNCETHNSIPRSIAAASVEEEFAIVVVKCIDLPSALPYHFTRFKQSSPIIPFKIPLSWPQPVGEEPFASRGPLSFTTKICQPRRSNAYYFFGQGDQNKSTFDAGHEVLSRESAR